MDDCIIENEELAFAESQTTVYLWLKTSNRFIPMSQIEKCKWGDNTKFVFNIVNEKQPTYKNKSVIKKQNISSYSFNSSVDYPDYNLTMPSITVPKIEPNIPKPDIEESLNDLFIGGAASIALLMSVIQQVKQKKKESEAANCCAKVQKIELDLNKIQANSKEENKTLHAEMIEQYKEMKELKEEAQETKEVIQKLIDRIRGDNHVEKRTKD